jgi:hypothetical protein
VIIEYQFAAGCTPPPGGGGSTSSNGRQRRIQFSQFGINHTQTIDNGVFWGIPHQPECPPRPPG